MSDTSSDIVEEEIPKNCSLRIKSINAVGEVQLEFNATMDTDTQKFVNSTFIDIYIEQDMPTED